MKEREAIVAAHSAPVQVLQALCTEFFSVDCYGCCVVFSRGCMPDSCSTILSFLPVETCKENRSIAIHVIPLGSLFAGSGGFSSRGLLMAYIDYKYITHIRYTC